MFHQLLTPIGGSLPLSFLVAALPVAVVLVMLGVLRKPAWQSSLAGVVVALIIAVGVWKMPLGMALNSAAAGVTFAIWPVMWIVFNAWSSTTSRSRPAASKTCGGGSSSTSPGTSGWCLW